MTNNLDFYSWDTIFMKMEVERKFIGNYLSKKHFTGGVITALLCLSLCLLLSLFYWDKDGVLSIYLAANAKTIFLEHEYWRLISTVLIHGDMKHLLSNSFMLCFLIYFVTSFYGKIISLTLVFVGGPLVSGLCLMFYQEEIFLVGASGIVYLLWGFWLSLYLLIQIHFSLTQRLVRVFGIFFILLVPSSYDPATSYMAHYLGFLVGLFFGVIYYLVKGVVFKKYEQWKYSVVFDEENLLDYSEQ